MVLGLLNTPAIFPLPKVFFQSTYLGLITYLSVWMTLAYLLTGCFLYITTSYPCPSKKCFFFESTPSSLIFFFKYFAHACESLIQKLAQSMYSQSASEKHKIQSNNAGCKAKTSCGWFCDIVG